jgi:probable F420-dependent oxidoreductase
MRFSVAIPTCVEGLLYPIPFITPERLMRVAVAAESLGYHSVWGNDHLSTQNYVKAAWPDPPNYYEPLVALSFVAGATKRIGLGTSIIVLPMREPVLLAKQAATLDQFSGGRLFLGVGVGAYREEFEAVYPDRRGANRGKLVEEGIQSLRALFTERNASFKGRYDHFENVECYPKPKQNPMPIYVGGNTIHAAERAGRWAQGWLPAVLPPEQLRQRLDHLQRAAANAGRDASQIDIAPQFSVSIAKTHEEAVALFHASHIYQHMLSLKKSTLKDVDLSQSETINLIGSPAEIGEKIQMFVQAGVTHFCSLIFGSKTIEDSIEQMHFFSEEVMNHFSKEGGESL